MRLNKSAYDGKKKKKRKENKQTNKKKKQQQQSMNFLHSVQDSFWKQIRHRFLKSKLHLILPRS